MSNIETFDTPEEFEKRRKDILSREGDDATEVLLSYKENHVLSGYMIIMGKNGPAYNITELVKAMRKGDKDAENELSSIATDVLQLENALNIDSPYKKDIENLIKRNLKISQNDIEKISRPAFIDRVAKVYYTSTADISEEDTPTKKHPKKLTVDDCTVWTSGKFGLREQKMHDIFNIYVTTRTDAREFNKPVTISLSLYDVIEKMGYKPTPANRSKIAKELKDEVLPVLNDFKISVTRKGKNGDFVHETIGLGAGHYVINTKQDLLLFEMSSKYAYYLKKDHALSKILVDKLRLKDDLSYYICGKLESQYFMDRNVEQGRHDTLKVSTILKNCHDAGLVLYPEETGDPTHWKRKLKNEKIERALNAIADNKLFKWEYVNRGGVKIDNSIVDTMSYSEWCDVFIRYELIPQAPDDTKRLEHKAQRIEEYQKSHPKKRKK